jgi:Na+-driven multidrug efflux pump
VAQNGTYYIDQGIYIWFTGIVRGCGRQKIGAFVNFVAYYIVGIPAALVFTFVCHLGVQVFYIPSAPLIIIIIIIE